MFFIDYSQFDIETEDLENVISQTSNITEICQIFNEKQKELAEKLAEGISFIHNPLDEWYACTEKILKDISTFKEINRLFSLKIFYLSLLAIVLNQWFPTSSPRPTFQNFLKRRSSL